MKSTTCSAPHSCRARRLLPRQRKVRGLLRTRRQAALSHHRVRPGSRPPAASRLIAAAQRGQVPPLSGNCAFNLLPVGSSFQGRIDVGGRRQRMLEAHQALVVASVSPTPDASAMIAALTAFPKCLCTIAVRSFRKVITNQQRGTPCGPTRRSLGYRLRKRRRTALARPRTAPSRSWAMITFERLLLWRPSWARWRSLASGASGCCPRWMSSFSMVNGLPTRAPSRACIATRCAATYVK
jgi:hypothetical protein